MREREAHQWKVSRSDGKVQPRSIKSATGVRAPVALEDPAYERWEFLAGNALRDMLYKPEDRLAGSFPQRKSTTSTTRTELTI